MREREERREKIERERESINAHTQTGMKRKKRN